MRYHMPKNKIVIFIICFVVFIINAPAFYLTHAATLSFYNYSTGSNVNYSGKQVTYTLNNQTIPLSYPGILIDGVALADYEELFGNRLGLSVQRNDNKIIISDGKTELVLNLNSKTARKNGKAETISVAPVKLKFNNETKYYVPTRYVAETFGYQYVWVSNISTVRITKTLSLSAENNTISYNGTLYTIKYQGREIALDMPAIQYNGAVFVPAKQIFESAGCTYKESNGDIAISKKDLTLFMQVNSKLSFINEKKMIANTVPLRITDNSTGNQATYVSLEFVADMLGFETGYSSSQSSYNLQDTVFTGCIDLYPDLLNGFWKNNTDASDSHVSPKNIYYEWESNTLTSEQEQNCLTKVIAFATEHADVVELFGVCKEDLYGFIDNRLLVFEIKNTSTDMPAQFYSDDSVPHLKYTLLTPLKNNIKLFFMLPEEDDWKIIEHKNSVQIVFARKDCIEESITTISSSEQTLPYPDDEIIIPLKNNVEISDISDTDFYWNHSFDIKISGNLTKNLNYHTIINPYYGVEISDIYYDAITDKTSITFSTNMVCGYRYTIQNGCLCVKIGKPDEFYSKIIVLDAGHGGIDPGAIKKGVYEKDLNYKILNVYAKKLFEQSDIKVYFTRETDVKIDLYERAAFASEVGADLFVSLHMNTSGSSSANGTEVFYSKDNNSLTETGYNSYQLAKILSQNMSAALGTKNRGASKSDFVVVKYNTVPAVLIELGFITNSTEFAKLTNANYQQKAAETLYKTIIGLYNDGLFR